MKFDVVTFGSAVIDVFVDTDVSEKKNFISYPAGSKILIKDLKFDVGGGATNTAVAFSRLGLKTGCICKLGSDENGRKVLRLLKKEGIKFLGKIGEGMTGYSLILDSREKDRTILTYKGANDDLSFKELKLRKIAKTNWIYCSSMMGKSFETQKKTAVFLTKKGVKLAFNPSSYLIKRKDLKFLLRLTSILILNREEAKMLLNKNKQQEKDLLLGLHKLINKNGITVITNKNKLITCFDGKKRYYLKPHKIKVVERTGAGDALASGFVAGQIAGKSITESLELGLEESENVIRHFGAKNNLLRMKIK